MAWLAQREHSRVELRRKLLRRARLDAAAAGDAACAEPDAQASIEALLDWLEANAYLSGARFAESRVHARRARYGTLRIRQELAQHGIELAPDAAEALKASELERARAVWARKYGVGAADAAERARQGRFLASRGFSADVIRRVVQGCDDD